MARPHIEQVKWIVAFMEEHRELARGRLRGPEGRSRSAQLWADISSQLNAMGGCIKSCKMWQKYWADKKNWLKKTASMYKVASQRGDEVAKVPNFKELDKRILALMGEGFAESIPNVKIPSSNTQSEDPLIPPPMQTPPLYKIEDIRVTEELDIEDAVEAFETSNLEVSYSGAQSEDPLVSPPMSIPASLYKLEEDTGEIGADVEENGVDAFQIPDFEFQSPTQRAHTNSQHRRREKGQMEAEQSRLSFYQTIARSLEVLAANSIKQTAILKNIEEHLGSKK